MKKSVLVFGTKFDLIARLKRLGLNVVLVDKEVNPDADVTHIVNVSKLAIGEYTTADFAQFESQICGLIVCLEVYVELAAALREKYFKHLLGPSLSQARIVRDKFLLKKFLSENNIPVARFSDIQPFEALKQLLGLPFLVKPRLGYLAQGIEVLSSKNDYDIWMAIHKSKVDLYLAEQYLQNPTEYCCDTIVAGSIVIAQFPGEYTVNCLESNKTHGGFGVNFPGFLPADHVEEIKGHTRKFIATLGVTDGFFHTEFLRSGDEWYFGESGCRLPGGLQVPAESYVSNVDLLDLYIKMFVPHLRPKEISPVTTFPKPYVGYYLYPKKAGRVEKITNQIPQSSGILQTTTLIKVGDIVAHEDSSVSTVATVIFEARSLDELKAWTLKAPELFKVEYVNLEFSEGSKKKFSDIIDAHLVAYNNQDLELFVSFFQDEVTFNKDGNVEVLSKPELSKKYCAFFKSNPKAKARILDRNVDLIDSSVSDLEELNFNDGVRESVRFYATYKIHDRRILSLVLVQVK